ncbi:MAG: hypothetical protein J0G30_05955 [Actinomycetales bacterium]|nr:hypothetical protein [Actinomycetales bacterium]
MGDPELPRGATGPRHLLVEAALDALAVLLPVTCAGCGADDRALCAACRARLAPRPAVRTELRRPARGGGGEVGGGGATIPVIAALDYAGVARSVVAAAKDGGRSDAIPALARALAAAVTAAVAEVAAREGADAAARLEVCAVPTTWRARRRRGSWPLGAMLARAGVRPRRLLAVAAAGAPQKSLDLAARRRARRDAFRARGSLAGRVILLVDDVVTSGSTLAAAATALEAAGARVAIAAVVAATPRRDGRGEAAILGDVPEPAAHPPDPGLSERDTGRARV